MSDMLTTEGERSLIKQIDELKEIQSDTLRRISDLAFRYRQAGEEQIAEDIANLLLPKSVRF